MTGADGGPGGDGAPVLPDGTYDVFIVDATEETSAGDSAEQRVMHLDLAVTSGEHKGEVLTLAATGLAGEEHELLGMPATLTVTDARPSIRIDT